MKRAGALALCVALGSCQTEPSTAGLRAFRVTDRAQLFGGGPRALGDVGDYVLMNDQIRVVIQNAGFSRGFGVYGGGIIDADLRRPDEQGRGQSRELGGHDIFAEMFPSFFFQAVACNKVEILSDGSAAYDKKYGNKTLHYDAGTAVIRASGPGGEFLTMLRLFDSLFLNYVLPTERQSTDGNAELLRMGILLADTFVRYAIEIAALINTNSRFEVDYALKPGARHVEIGSRIINLDGDPLPIPSALLKNQTFQNQLGGIDFSTLRVPIGMVMLYGRLNDVWMPGIGFDLRHPLEHAFKRALPLPAFSGLVAEFIASASHRLNDRVSYGLIAPPSPTDFVALNADAYHNGGKWKEPWTPVDNTSLLVPFTAISFIGIFSDSIQTVIPGHEYVEQVQDFIIGAGDVASIVDEMAAVRGAPTGSYEAILRDSASGEPVGDGQIVIYQELAVTADAFASADDYLDSGLRLCETAGPKSLCRPYSQDYPDIAGNMIGRLPPGKYAYRVQGEGRPLGPWVRFAIDAGARTMLTPTLPPAGVIQAFAADEDGRPIPAKVSIVGRYDRPYTDAQRRSGAVFDIQAGEAYRFSDMLDDNVDGQRAYIEATGYTDINGQALIRARPGDYTAYFSRGFEYDLVPVPVHVDAGNGTAVAGRVTRVVDTTGWMSMDGHVHSDDSIDSSMAVPDRLQSAAGEGVEIAISTNHNFVTDWRPDIDRLGLSPFMVSFVGIEFTTLESGHFNSYPLDYPIGPVTHGSFEWFGRPPKELFAGLRTLAAGGAGDNIVVCNHPRDTTVGYYNQYGRSSLTGGMIAWGTSKRLAGANGTAFFDKDGNNLIDYGCDALEIVNGKLAHEIHGVRVPADWPAACYVPLPAGFNTKTQLDPCSLNGKILRPSSTTAALVPGTLLLSTNAGADPGASGVDNQEAVFPGAVDDWFHRLNQGFRDTGLATSDSHAGVGEEPGAPRTFLYFGSDEPDGVTAEALVDVVKRQHAATLSHGPFLTFTVAKGDNATGGTAIAIGGELMAPGGKVTVNYRLAAPPWVSVNRIQVWVNGRLIQKLPIDPGRDLSDRARAPNGPVAGQLGLTLDKDSWIVLEAVGDRPMFPVVTGTEEPFLQVSDAVGALAGPLGIAASTDISAVVVGNEAPYALTNPVWVRVGATRWTAPGVVPFNEINTPDQDPHVGVLRTRN
jgi:hypothetical protein